MKFARKYWYSDMDQFGSPDNTIDNKKTKNRVYISMTGESLKTDLKKTYAILSLIDKPRHLNTKQNLNICFNEAKNIIHMSRYRISLIKETIEI